MLCLIESIKIMCDDILKYHEDSGENIRRAIDIINLCNNYIRIEEHNIKKEDEDT